MHGHPEINSLPSLQQSVCDFLPNATKPLPLIQEILDAAKDHISCDYLIYTNCDIILTPHFYEKGYKFHQIKVMMRLQLIAKEFP